MKEINHVAVIGSGIMGSGIAAFFANQGITADLYDVELKIAAGNLSKMASPKAKIPLLYTPRFGKRITPRANEEMAENLAKADLIIEAIPEKMEWKQELFQKIDQYRKNDTIIASNTSGLSINRMIGGVSENMQEHFIGTHYFNPVRYLPLVELIPGGKTKPELISFMQSLLSQAGKKCIICRDTPNFVANRVGIFSLMKTLELMQKYRFDVETVDMITGTTIGNPKTATMRLSDMVGIDTIIHVAQNVYDNCPEDENRDLFQTPEIFKRMLADNMLGEKTRKGFYQKTKSKEILALNLETWEYSSKKNPRDDVVRVAKERQSVAARIRAMVNGNSPINNFCRELLLSTGAYALHRLGEIAADIPTIDNGLKWGFNREVGPIETLDIIGVEASIESMRNLGIKVPSVLEDVAASTGRIYDQKTSTMTCFHPTSKSMQSYAREKDYVTVDDLKRAGHILRENLSARLLDMGDGALLLEIDSRMVPSMNPIDDFVISMIKQAFEVIEKDGFRCLIIGNQASNFCAGANIQLLLELCKKKEWKKIEAMSKSFQDANMALYHAPFPVVTVPHGMTLGGGMEVTLAGHKRVATAELYCGLVEVGVGLLPGGAGNLLLLLQFINSMKKMRPGPVPAPRQALELIAYGAVSSSAYDAIEKGLLLKDDIIVLDKDEQLSKAKELALSMVEGHQAREKQELLLPGHGTYLVMENMVNELLDTHRVPPHGALIAKKMAHVLTGGEKASPAQPVSEDYVLELEREAFVELCSNKNSQARIAHMLKHKKPLMN